MKISNFVMIMTTEKKIKGRKEIHLFPTLRPTLTRIYYGPNPIRSF
jgi:hypothetical protein